MVWSNRGKNPLERDALIEPRENPLGAGWFDRAAGKNPWFSIKLEPKSHCAHQYMLRGLIVLSQSGFGYHSNFPIYLYTDLSLLSLLIYLYRYWSIFIVQKILLNHYHPEEPHYTVLAVKKKRSGRGKTNCYRKYASSGFPTLFKCSSPKCSSLSFHSFSYSVLALYRKLSKSADNINNKNN